MLLMIDADHFQMATPCPINLPELYIKSIANFVPPQMYHITKTFLFVFL